MKIYSRGMSLIELMVALAVTAIIASSAYQILALSQDSAELQYQSSRRTLELDRGFDQIQRDLQQAVSRSTRDSAQQSFAAMQGDNALLESEESSLRFTRTGWTNPLKRKRSQSQRLQYFIRHKQLFRRHYLQLDRGDETSFRDEVLISGIESIQLRYLYISDSAEPKQWLEQWPPNSSSDAQTAALEKLPVAIDMRFATTDKHIIQRIFLLPEVVL